MFARLTQHGRSHVTSTASSPNRRPAAQRGVRLVAALASTLSVLALSAGTAAADSTYLKVIGPGGNQVPGEVTLTELPNQIEVSSWSWGATNSFSFNQTTGAISLAKPSYRELNFTKALDRSTARFLDFFRNGDVLPSARLTVRKTSAGVESTYLEYCLENVVVSGYDVAWEAAANGRPTEHLTLGAEKVSQRYSYVGKDGKTVFYTTGVAVASAAPVAFNGKC